MKRLICAILLCSMLCLPALALTGENFVFFSAASADDALLPAQAHIVGDANGDETVDLRDAIAMIRYMVGTKQNTARAAMDIDGDGDCTMQDLFALLHYLLGDQTGVSFGELSE